MGRRFTTAFVGLILTAASAGLAFGQAAQSLVKFEIKDGAIEAPLTGKRGDPQKGRQIAANRVQGNCLACHEISALKNELVLPEQATCVAVIEALVASAFLRWTAAGAITRADG